MKTKRSKDLLPSLVVAALLLPLIFTSVAFLISCGGGGGGGASSGSVTTGTVTTYITDPPVCKVPNGDLESVWVTITRVRAHRLSDAGPGDSGWVNLVDLRDDPKQIDLLNLDEEQGLLELLGSTSLTEGKYQQIRIYLLSNTPGLNEEVPESNECDGFGYNCVVERGEVHELNLSSQAQTGLKIPSGQIAGGGLTVMAGQLVDLVIDFDACSSIVRQGNGQYRLKPTLRAGAVSVIDRSLIQGRVVDGTTGEPISGAVVFLETRESLPGFTIGRVRNQLASGPDGRFSFNSLPEGFYDVVAAAQTASFTYNATVTLEVPPGSDMGDIPLVREDGGPATIEGSVTTQTGSDPEEADVQFTALQAASAELLVTIPLFGSSTPLVVTTGASSCTSTDVACGNYSLVVPASNPQIGTFGAPPISYQPPALGPVDYQITAVAFPVDGIPDATVGYISEPITVSPSGTTQGPSIELTFSTP
jgi:hypothetical protein